MAGDARITFAAFFMVLVTPAMFDQAQSCLDIEKMDVLGRGYDILKQTDGKQALEFKYSQCLTALDGSYQVADNVVVQSRRYTQGHLTSELFEDWSAFSSATDRSLTSPINVFGGRADIAGVFSHHLQSAKNKMVSYKSVIARSQIRNVVLSAYIDASSPPVDPMLLSALTQASSFLDAGHIERARYVLGLVVRDYGTHFTNRVDLGGLIIEDNYILAEFVKNHSKAKHHIAEIASQDFLHMLSFRNNDNPDCETDLVKEYRRNRVFSEVESIGGNPLSSNMSLESWIQSVPDNVASVSRELQPLVNIITSTNFPLLSNNKILKLRNQLGGVIERYLEYNTHLGCTNSSSANFDYSANIDDGSCQLLSLHFGFGGMYQQCQMVDTVESVNVCEIAQLNGVNPLTNDYSCLPNYQPIVVLNTTTIENQCLSSQCSADACSESCFKLVTTWCAPNLNVSPDMELHFGGLYSSQLTNPTTGRHACPTTYIPVPLGHDVKVCVSASFDLGVEHSIPFGGFFTCNQGNPNTAFDTLASNWAKGCPPGFSEHVATFERDCVVKYCMQGRSFTIQSDLPLVIPPFVSSSIMFQDNSQVTDQEGMASGTIAAIVVSSILAVVVIVLLLIAAWKRRKRHFHPGVEAASEDALIQSSPKEPHYQSFLESSSSSHRE